VTLPTVGGWILVLFFPFSHLIDSNGLFDSTLYVFRVKREGGRARVLRLFHTIMAGLAQAFGKGEGLWFDFEIL
jgi:hypothetical protein